MRDGPTTGGGRQRPRDRRRGVRRGRRRVGRGEARSRRTLSAPARRRPSCRAWILVAGLDMRPSATVTPVRAGTGHVPQDTVAALTPSCRSSTRSARSSCAHDGLSRRAARADAARRSSLRSTSTHTVSDRRLLPDEMSGGMRQRALVASAWLDPRAGRRRRTDVVARSRDDARRDRGLSQTPPPAGSAVLLSPTTSASRATVADRIVVLHQGAIVETGPTDRVPGSPASRTPGRSSRRAPGSNGRETTATATDPDERRRGVAGALAGDLVLRVGSRCTASTSTWARAPVTPSSDRRDPGRRAPPGGSSASSSPVQARSWSRAVSCPGSRAGSSERSVTGSRWCSRNRRPRSIRGGGCAICLGTAPAVAAGCTPRPTRAGSASSSSGWDSRRIGAGDPGTSCRSVSSSGSPSHARARGGALCSSATSRSPRAHRCRPRCSTCSGSCSGSVRQVAVLLVTHDLAVASQLCQTLSVLDSGRIVETGPLDRIVRDPATDAWPWPPHAASNPTARFATEALAVRRRRPYGAHVTDVLDIQTHDHLRVLLAAPAQERAERCAHPGHRGRSSARRPRTTTCGRSWITGNGDAFCSGLDLRRDSATTTRHPPAGRVDAPDDRGPDDHFAYVMRAECEKPILVGVNGVAVGIGVSLAMAVDFRLAAPSARFHPGYARVGASPDGGPDLADAPRRRSGTSGRCASSSSSAWLRPTKRSRRGSSQREPVPRRVRGPGPSSTEGMLQVSPLSRPARPSAS